MKTKPLPLSGAYYLEPQLHEDSRGYFFEWFSQQAFQVATGVALRAVQFNYSKSSENVLRGMHWQTGDQAQAKLIAVCQGEIQDVVVDLREGSPTFGRHYAVVLSAEKRNQLFIPRGFAHGFLVLSEQAEIFYAMDNFYSPAHERGVRYNDPYLGIRWERPDDTIIVSDKDAHHPPFNPLTHSEK